MLKRLTIYLYGTMRNSEEVQNNYESMDSCDAFSTFWDHALSEYFHRRNL
jgi:hypothetical protein